MIKLTESYPLRRCAMGYLVVFNVLPPAMQVGLQAAYAGPGRHYHDANHIGGMWTTWVGLRGMGASRYPDTSLLWATAFHDVVYDPQAAKGENEQRSAEFLATAAQRAGIDRRSPLADVLYEADLMIRATADHLTAGDDLPEGDGIGQAQRIRLFCDLDLSGLACPWTEFDDNTRLLRLEQSHLPDAEAAARQRGFLTTMAAAPRIYRSGLMPAWWEVTARENIARALAEPTS